jgi:hypothetical protein
VHVITRSNEHEVMRLAWIRACMAAVSAKVMAWEVSDWLEWGTIPVIRAESSVWQYRSIASVVVATHVSMRPGILRTMVVMFWGAYRPHSLPQDKRESSGAWVSMWSGMGFRMREFSGSVRVAVLENSLEAPSRVKLRGVSEAVVTVSGLWMV